nr:Hsp33 family molecular chaperone HslO [Sphingosinicella soli]
MAGRVLPFTIPARSARGRAARLGPALAAILSAHDYPAPLRRLLGEALILTVLIGTTVQKGDGQTTVQAQSSGPIDLLVCDYRAGEIRGYLRFDPERLDEITPDALLPALFGTGYLAITIERDAEERYQGIVPLEGDTLCHAVERYFVDSEQIPTLVRGAVRQAEDGAWEAGGLLVQHLPHGETDGPRLAARTGNDDWDHVLALASTISEAELTDSHLSEGTLLWRLFNEDEVRVSPAIAITRGCRCSVQHFRDVLGRFPAEERAEMRGPGGTIDVNCEFCSRLFPIDIGD